ncbi:IS66 insertion sequence transposase [Rhizobium sp. CF080]|nr:IS66 insertion sequence transposase [Rhizobium sp. CF080]
MAKVEILTGGERIANILTIIETAKLHGHNPETYLTEVLGHIKDCPKDRLEDLLPWNMVPVTTALQKAV